MNPPPYIPDNKKTTYNSEQIIMEQPTPMPAPTAPPMYSQFPKYDVNAYYDTKLTSDISKLNIKKKPRIIIPFPCYDIDITNFPRIKLVSNSITDGKQKSKNN